ncbi:Core-2/I-Branching enzyme, partial [Ostertagia ostertagi]
MLFMNVFKLISDVPGWEHVIMMQNYDIMIKSIYETTSILQALDGTNDIGGTECDPNRWDHTAKWDVRSLKLFRDEEKTTSIKLNTTLRKTCGLVQTTLSRATVGWLVKTVDLTTLLDQLNTD